MDLEGTRGLGRAVLERVGDMIGKRLCLALITVAWPGTATGQEAERLPANPATASSVLAAMRAPYASGLDYERRPEVRAVRLLRQRYEARSRAELDAFADELVRIVFEGRVEGRQLSMAGRHARNALRASANQGEKGEIPYEGAWDALYRIWEAEARTAPPGERWDYYGALGALYRIEPRGRGRDLLYAEIAAAAVPTWSDARPWKPGDTPEKPVLPGSTPWCRLVRTVWFYWKHGWGDSRAPEAVREGDPDAMDAWGLRRVEAEVPGTSKTLKEICGTNSTTIY